MGRISRQIERKLRRKEMKGRILAFFLLLIPFLWPHSLEAQTETTYVIGPSDVLEIIVWKEPDFSREVTVRPDGRITLPLIDDVLAAGKTPMQLKSELEKRLKEYIDLPVVTVIVKELNSKRYYMIGEIARPGEYLLSKPMTILQALAVAGGFTEWAKKDKIMVIRTNNAQQEILRFNYEEATKGRKVNDFYLKADDIILVP